MERYIDPDTGLNTSKFIVSYQYELPGDSNIYYGLSNEIDLIQAITSGAESTDEYAFTFAIVIPSNAQFVKYYLVYRGKLGNEVDAVIGKVYYENLAISAPDNYVYSITDGSQTPYVDTYGHAHQQFSNLKAKVMITDITGYIQSGNIQAKVRYKKRTDYQWDLSADPPTEEAREADFSYSASSVIPLSSEDITALNNLELRQFTFDFTNDPIPAGITDLSLRITINGIMEGETTEETIASGSKDLNEPAHHLIWNLSDMFSLEWALYTADYIRGSSTLRNKVDHDHDGILNEVSEGEPYIDPYDVTFEIGYMRQSPPIDPVYTSATVVLPAGRHIRLVALVDYPAYIRMGHIADIVPSYDYSDLSFTGVINQVNDGQWQSTPVTAFRYGLDGLTEVPIRKHFAKGVLSCQPGYVDPQTGYTFCPYIEVQAIPADLLPFEAVILFPDGTLMQQQSPTYSQSVSESQSRALGIAIVK